jgi:hypothetical protein
MVSEDKKIIAEKVQNACIKAAREGFRDASMSGLCSEGAIEAAISAIELLDIKKIVADEAEPNEQ